MIEKFNAQNNNNEVFSDTKPENIEQINLKIGQKWSTFESNFKKLEGEIKNEKDHDDGKRILKKTAQVILSLGKKLTIATGISVAAITGYTALNLDKQMSFNDRLKAEKELEQDGIPSDQKYSAYKPGISELIYRSVTPFGYQDDVDENGLMPNLFEKLEEFGLPNSGFPQDVLSNIRFGRVERIETLNNLYEQEMQETQESITNMEKELGQSLIGSDGNLTSLAIEKQKEIYKNINKKYQKLAHKQAYSSKTSGPHQIIGNREDAWRLYLGLNQEYETFDISNYKPSRGNEDKYYFSIKNFWQGFSGLSTLDSKYIQQLNENLDLKEVNFLLEEEGIKGKIMILSHLPDKKMILRDFNSNIMGNYTLGLGQDHNGSYIYYYDNWDLSSQFAENLVMKGVGKPYEIYDRLYYNPVDFSILGSDQNLK